jgi:hypothetical protein
VRSILSLLALSVASYAADGWTELSGTALISSGVCATGTGGIGGCGAAVEAYSGGTLDTTRSRLLIWGGGHADYNGNEVYALYPPGTTPAGVACSSPTAPAICRVKNPSASLRDQAALGCYADQADGTTPNSRHTYDGIAYIGNRDKMFAQGGSLACQQGYHYGDTWTLDMSSLAWLRRDPVNGTGTKPADICNGGGCGSSGQGPWTHAVYDPTRQLVFTETALWGTLWSYNDATNTYTSLATSLAMAAYGTWVVDPKRHRLYMIGASDGPGAGNATTSLGTPLIAYIDISVGSSYAVTTVTATGCDGLAGAPNPGVDYDTVLDRIVGWPNFGNTVYVFDPDTATCTTQTFSGGPPDSRDAANAVYTTGTYGRFRYVPSLDAFVVVNDANTNAYLLKLPSNSLTIKNTGATTSNYPAQVGRAFAQGEIPSGSLPRASVDGTPVDTQVDVKARWSDDSLKHAIVSFLVPTFTANTTYTVTFAAGTTVGNTAITKASMLADYDFDAVISLTKTGVTKTKSALAMLNADDYTVWASGPIATTILLGNHAQGTTCGGNTASTYDFGFTSYCAFRPLFQATFWATTHQVYVRYIGEIANTEQLEDVVTDSGFLTAGSASPATVYTLPASLTMHAKSRWTKTAWIGGTPPVAAYNHNLAYLAYTKALPNYDTSKTISESDIATTYSAWTAASKNLYDRGLWDSPLGGGGGHSHVGPYPPWNMRWLYTGDYRSQEEAIGQTDLFATVEFHHREGGAGRKLDQAGLVSGIGYPVSASSRPSLRLNDLNAENGADAITPVGTITQNSNWTWDAAHFPEPFSSVYLVTGDYFYLEEDLFFSGYYSMFYNAFGVPWKQRGPTGKEGNLPEQGQRVLQTRGLGWAIRTRVETAWLTPDDSPMKPYLELLIADVIAYLEGARGITTTPYNGNTMWTFGQSAAAYSADSQWEPHTTPSPLHFWDNGNAGICTASAIIDATVSADCDSPWMVDYVLYALGRCTELGYACTALRNWLGENTIGSLTDAGYNPYLAAAYRVPIVQQSGSAYYTTWADVKTGFTSSVQNTTNFDDINCDSCGDGEVSSPNGNVQPLVAAVSMVADQTGGAAAWNWVSTNITASIAGADLKWAILPRSITASPSTGGGMRMGGKVTSGGKIVR